MIGMLIKFTVVLEAQGRYLRLWGSTCGLGGSLWLKAAFALTIVIMSNNDKYKQINAYDKTCWRRYLQNHEQDINDDAYEINKTII